MSRRRRRREERDSLPGEDDEPGLGARFATGCGVGCVVALLLVGALGIGVGAQRRFAGWGEDDFDDTLDEPTEVDEVVRAPDPPFDDRPPVDPDLEEDMRRRYRAGPYVRIDSMVPSGRLLPRIDPNTVVNGRTTDNPWVVPGAELRPNAMPGPAAGGPAVHHDPSEAIGRPLSVLARTPARVLVRSEDSAGGTTIDGYLVEFAGYPGHFYLPATIETELGVVQAGGSDGANVQFTIASPVRPDGSSLAAGQTFEVTMRVAAVDNAGRPSAPVSRQLMVMAVGAGDVEVTLTMGEPTDLDLYVTDPTGVTIYYGNTNAASGGHLDLDANAACSSNMGVNNEHIYWPAGQAPSGTYRVHVSHYESCINGRPLDYRVTLSACGETVVLAGHFDGVASSSRCMQASSATRAHCQEVVTFEVPPCAAVP